MSNKKTTTSQETLPKRVIVFEVINATNKPKEFNLFGFDRHAHIKDFGIPRGLYINNLQSDDGYATMLYSTAQKKYLIKYWRLIGSENNITNDFKGIFHSIDGKKYTVPIKFSQHKSSMEDYDDLTGDKIITIQQDFTLLSNSYFSGFIDAHSKLKICLYFD